jgi:hypothetical protein
MKSTWFALLVFYAFVLLAFVEPAAPFSKNAAAATSIFTGRAQTTVPLFDSGGSSIIGGFSGYYSDVVNVEQIKS